ncbi:MAG TPA: AAA family ATPase [Acetobacteraceae bacterium]|nr:AAA family ATPase [Acetobacteraceae bacterium]
MDRDQKWQRRRRAFKRHAAAAEAGLHLPSTPELLRGMSFMKDLASDAQAFAERLLPRLDLRAEAGRALYPLLTALTLRPLAEDHQAAAEGFTRFAEVLGKRIDGADGALRCYLYAAALGSPQAARKIGLEGLRRGADPRRDRDEALDYALSGLGWLLYSFWTVEPWEGEIAGLRETTREHAEGLLDRLASEVKRRSTPEPERTSNPAPRSEPQRQADPAKEVPGPGVIVLRSLGDTDLAGAGHVTLEFRRIVNQSLPLIPVPDLALVRDRLLRSFPHAASVAAAILNPLASETHVRLRPTLLLGSPGSGKTTFANRLFALLGVPYETYACGGVADSSIGGTGRRWASGEPALPLSLIRRHGTASPGVILDELEKGATSRHNGMLHDVLLAFLEPQSAQSFFDPYVQARADLSHVLWLGTVNAIEGIPLPLRDRCRLIRFPDPAPVHLPQLAASLLEALVAERGLDPRWALPLDAFELEALAAAWPGGSVRALARLLEAVLAARDGTLIRH